MNAKKITEKYIYGKNIFICLDLELIFLELNEGSWELDACHRLIGGLNGALSKISFPGTWSCRLTPVVRL